MNRGSQSGSQSCQMTFLRVGLALFILTLAAGCATGCATVKDGDSWSSKSQSARSAPTTIGDRPLHEPDGSNRAIAAVPDASRADVPTLAAPSTIYEPTEPVEPSALRAKAIAVAQEASRSTSPIVRAHAIEALGSAPEELDAVAGRGLVDANRGVRFVAVLSLAKAKRCGLAHLIEPLAHDDSASVRAAALAALQMCGRSPDLSPFAEMVRSDDPEVRANAYLALGVIGDPSAIGLVRHSVGAGFALTDHTRVRVVELQAAECLVRLGRTIDVEPIRAALWAPAEQGGLSAIACQMIGRLKDERSRPMLERLVQADGQNARSAEIRLAAIDALGRLGVSQALLLGELRPYLSSSDPGLRAQAALALGADSASAAGGFGATSGSESLALLAALLEDADPVVRVAAASSVLALLPGRAESPPRAMADRAHARRKLL